MNSLSCNYIDLTMDKGYNTSSLLSKRSSSSSKSAIIELISDDEDDDYVIASKMRDGERRGSHEDDDFHIAMKMQEGERREDHEDDDFHIAMKMQKEDEDFHIAMKMQKEDEDYLVALKMEKEEKTSIEEKEEKDINFARQIAEEEHERRQKEIENIVASASFGREPEQLTKLRNTLDEFLAKSASKCVIEQIILNKFAHPETPSELYEKFIGAWIDVNATHKNSLLFGFHGTAEENLDTILKNGLDPKRRTGQAFGKGEYFGTRAEVSIPYCKKHLCPSLLK